MSKPYIHAISSVKRFRGQVSDYEFLHEFFDSSKQVIAISLHRSYFHHAYGIFLAAKIFGDTIKNSDGLVVSVRDIGEMHVMEDFCQKFIPSLSDYTSLLPNDNQLIDEVANLRVLFKDAIYKPAYNLINQPLNITGDEKSLLLTYNTWFLGEILPMVFKDKKLGIGPGIGIAPHRFFNQMDCPGWINNGNGICPSFKKIDEDRKNKVKTVRIMPLRQVEDLDVSYDGSLPREITDGNIFIEPETIEGGDISYGDDYTELKPVQEEVTTFLQCFEDNDYKEIFGDHISITVTKDNIQIEEYTDHD